MNEYEGEVVCNVAAVNQKKQIIEKEEGQELTKAKKERLMWRCHLQKKSTE